LPKRRSKFAIGIAATSGAGSPGDDRGRATLIRLRRALPASDDRAPLASDGDRRLPPRPVLRGLRALAAVGGADRNRSRCGAPEATAMSPRVDRGEIARAVALLVAPDTVVELRAPGSQRGTLSGYFDTPEALIDAAASLNDGAPGVYITLNPVHRALLARATNRIKPYAKHTTSDADVTCRRWMLLDFDPIRPAGISSTDAEHEAALAAARAYRTSLVEDLGCAPDSLVLADSGNGAHVLVRVDLSNSPESTALVRRCLEAVALFGGTETVRVDTDVYNAARISKMYGTLAAKGDAMPERPHRLACVLDAPTTVIPAPTALLERLAALRPAEPPRRAGAGGDFDVREWLGRHGIAIVREKPWMNGATVIELTACPLGDHEHHRNEAVVILLASGMVLYTCRHQTCQGRQWADLRKHFEGPRTSRHARASGRGADEPQSPRDDDAPSEARTGATTFFGKDGRFVPAWMGKHLLAEASIRLGHDRRLWRYVDGVYRPDGEDWAKDHVRTLVGDAFRRQQLDQVNAWLRAQLPSLGHHAPTEFINCRNGLLEWATGKLRPHTPDVLSTNQIPVPWKTGATSPMTVTFLAETVPWDALDLVEELLGYALYPGNPFRKAVLLFGPGFNGKSVLLGLFEGLLGSENVATIPLQVLSENRFAGADLFGKLANICGDLDARAIEHTDLFKQATGGDSIRAEFKFRDAFNFRCYALPLFSANELPRTADQTDAWFDRWIIIPMRWRFDGAKEDPALAGKLATEREGLLVRAVTGLRRLMARGRFALPASVMDAGRRYRQTLDTVRSFVAEECRFDRDAWVDRAKLYRRYRAWCHDGGRMPLANHTFNDHFIQAFGTRVFLRKRTGRPCWFGVKLDAEPSEETSDFGDVGDDLGMDGCGGNPRPGDAGDVGDDFSTQSQARAGSEGRLRNPSPASPTSPDTCEREPGVDDGDLGLPF
jgi:P4 family phage/plasmid primase-like protien